MEDIKVIILTLLGIFLVMSYINSSKPVEKFTEEEVQQRCDKSNARVEEIQKEVMVCDKDRKTSSINDELNCRFVDDRYIVVNDDVSSWCDSKLIKDKLEVVYNNTYDPSKIILVEKKKELSTNWDVTGYDGIEHNYEYEVYRTFD
jgi:hypothetical protein